MIATRRSQTFAQLSAKTFDLLVVGGGIVGAGIARDAAMRGLSVALIEQGDFAGATSSNTSKLIHGGLRYLEQGQLHLVSESLRERQTLRTIAPSLVQPLPLMIPVYDYSKRPAWKIAAGLFLYDFLSFGRGLGRHRMLSRSRALAFEPALRVQGLAGAGMYMDCRMDDARLCLANVLQAARFGAVCANYTRLKQWLNAHGRLCGGLLEDRLSGRQLEVQARAVVNATGPWADHARHLSNPKAEARLSPIKGIHVIVRRLAETALFVESRSDHRLFFILPWENHSLIGTTESAVTESLEDLRATTDEVDSLLEQANLALPGSRLTAEDVIATFAGARPLLSFGGSATAASREHRLEEDEAGLISILGGKYTTYRLMAQQTVDWAMQRERFSVEHCLTEQVHLIEPLSPVTLEQLAELVLLIDAETLARLTGTYGIGTVSILQLIGSEPALAEPLCPHHPQTAAEVVYAVQHELACNITDVLARRTRIAFSPCQGLSALPVIEDIFQRYAGLSPHQTAEQVEAYRWFLACGLSFRDGRPDPAKYVLH